MKRKPAIKYVRWSELSATAKRVIDTSGHPSNRPTSQDKQRKGNLFAEDGSGWRDVYALAGIFSI